MMELLIMQFFSAFCYLLSVRLMGRQIWRIY